MEELQKLKELIAQVRKKNPGISRDECVHKMMEEFVKWRPFFNEELEHWRMLAEELAGNYLSQ